MRDFHHTLNVLVKAYLNDTLQHGNCSACAVGNMVADGCGYTYKKRLGFGLRWNNAYSLWDNVFVSYWLAGRLRQDINAQCYHSVTKEQIDSTGYTWQELARIEFAFESADNGQSQDEAMFNGLMSVVDVLADIHGIDLKVREEAKALFVKA